MARGVLPTCDHGSRGVLRHSRRVATGRGQVAPEVGLGPTVSYSWALDGIGIRCDEDDASVTATERVVRR